MWRVDSLEKTRCWERLKAGGEGGDRGWDGWMASLTQWAWVWSNSRRQWRTGKPGVLQSMGSQRVRHDFMTEQHHLSMAEPIQDSHYFTWSVKPLCEEGEGTIPILEMRIKIQGGYTPHQTTQPRIKGRSYVLALVPLVKSHHLITS